MVYWVPLVPSPGEIGKEVVDNIIEVCHDVFVKSSKPNPYLVIECQAECHDFSDFRDGYVGSTYFIEALDVIICIPKPEETRNYVRDRSTLSFSIIYAKVWFDYKAIVSSTLGGVGVGRLANVLVCVPRGGEDF